MTGRGSGEDEDDEERAAPAEGDREGRHQLEMTGRGWIRSETDEEGATPTGDNERRRLSDTTGRGGAGQRRRDKLDPGRADGEGAAVARWEKEGRERVTE